MLSEERRKRLLSFIQNNSLDINSLEILDLALTHRSFSGEKEEGGKNNEKLEFLGDSVLALITAEYIFLTFPSLQEGEFSKIKSVVVSEESLAEVAKAISLDKYILLGKGEENNNGRGKKAVLADALEAVIAALYLDGGFERAKTFVLSFIPEQIERLLEGKISYRDYKTELQEYWQKKRGKVPVYNLVAEEGPDHLKIFRITVKLGNKEYGPGEGRSKKEAEQKAAAVALSSIFKKG